MKPTGCPFEEQVLAAIKKDEWPDDLRRHLTACPHCQETVYMMKHLKALSTTDIEHSLPNYRLIWLHAQYARRQERISILDILMLVGMALLGLAGFLGIMFWQFRDLFTGVLGKMGISFPHMTNVISSGAPVAVFLGLIVIVWILTRDSSFMER